MAPSTETAQLFPPTRALLPLDLTGQRLCSTFPYLWQPIVSPNGPKPEWQTITKYPLRPRVLWAIWQDPEQLVGVRFDSQTTYALIDIDRDSPHHPAQDPSALPTLRLALETIGLYRTVLIRSSASDGLHLYIPLPAAVPTFGLANALKQCLEAQNFTLAPGQLEIFPNCKSYALPGSYTEYNAHRLPLQPDSGSHLLDDDGHAVSQDLGRFFAAWDLAAQGQMLEELQPALAIARQNRRQRRRPSSIVADWQQDLRTEIEAGWTDRGQTNHLLKTIACYGVVFEGLKGEALAVYVQEMAINAPGYGEWCQHQHEISRRAQTWANAAEGYYWKLGDAPTRGLGSAANNIKPFPPHPNATKAEDAQQRIQAVVATLVAAEQLPALATARVKAIAATGISTRTLYRYLELWHPEQIDAYGQPCKTARLDSDPAILEPDFPDPPKTLEPNQSGEFYTEAQNMKSSQLFSDVLCWSQSDLNCTGFFLAVEQLEILLLDDFESDRESALSRDSKSGE